MAFLGGKKNKNGFRDYGTYERKAKDKKKHEREYEKQLFPYKKKSKRKEPSIFSWLFSGADKPNNTSATKKTPKRSSSSKKNDMFTYKRSENTPQKEEGSSINYPSYNLNDFDPLLLKAAYVVVYTYNDSLTFLMKTFSIDVNRAEILVKQLKQIGIIGSEVLNNRILIMTEKELASYLSNIFNVDITFTH